MRRITKAALTLAAMVSTATTLAALAAGPASATYRPPSIRQVCTAAANGGIMEGTVCVLPPGVTTAPNSYSATIAVSKTGAAGATVTFALTAGSLPPGLTMPAQSGSGTVITGNPTKAGTYGFTVKATDGSLTATLAYQITVTVQGPPDQLLCTAANGSYLVSGVCTLPDATLGVPYQGHLATSHNAGGTLSIVAGALPAGLSLPATFGASGDVVSGTVTQPLGDYNTYTFTVQGTGDQGQPLYQAYQISVDPDQPLTITLAAGGSTLPPAMAGGAYTWDFSLSGGAAPYTWSVASGSLPPGLALTSPYATSGDNNSQLSGTPTTAGTYPFTIRVSDYDGQQATQQFSLTVAPPLQITPTTLPAGTVGVKYSRDLPAQGGTPPYTWSVVNNINELPPGLTLDTTAPDYNNVLTGTPTKAGTFSFPMQVQDSQDNTVSGTVTITINP
ncbi:MAG: Ig domain-containing protein [Streptosporangiaceae bacterium]